MVKNGEIVDKEKQELVDQVGGDGEEDLKKKKHRLNPVPPPRADGRRHRRRWTAIEKAAIYHGVRKYKVGEWAKIKEDDLFKQALVNRTNVQIKVSSGCQALILAFFPSRCNG